MAKLTRVPRPIGEPISTLVDGGDIASRVKRLLDDDVPAQRCPTWSLVCAALAAAVGCALSYALLLRLDKAGLIERDLWCVDATVIRAHQSAAGAQSAGKVSAERPGAHRGRALPDKR